MKPPRFVLMGVAIAGISTTVWSAAMPDSAKQGPEGLSKSQRDAYSHVEKGREREARGKLRDGIDADLRDRARAGEVRRAADDVARSLLRRVP